MKVGVLALQGAFSEHIKVIDRLSVDAIQVKLPSDLIDVNAVIIPGGESTTISKLLLEYGLIEPIRALAMKGTPILGTCAGMIIMAKGIMSSGLSTLGLMDIVVERNAFGRQIDSFETDLSIKEIGEKLFKGVFIRAPVVTQVKNGVEIICQLNKQPVAVKQGNLIACAFHPELADDMRFHQFFISLITGDQVGKSNN